MRWVALVLIALVLGHAARAAPYAPPHKPWGDPDLEGTWSNRSLTMLERPASMSGLVAPDADVPALERKLLYDFVHPPGDAVGQFETEWRDELHLGRLDGQARSSWIVSPADGHVPYTPQGRRTFMARRAGMMAAFDGPEVRTTSDRCLTPAWSALGPPMLNAPYAANYQIVQTPDAVAILAEMNHEVRVIRLNARHETALTPRWGGDSIGHWEGRTLVVETVGFHPEETYRSPPFLMSPAARITERLTRTSPGAIKYEFAVDDPGMFTEVWRAEMPFVTSNERIFEYACHEGNYSMRGILAGARRTEADAAAKPRP